MGICCVYMSGGQKLIYMACVHGKHLTSILTKAKEYFLGHS